MFIQGVSQIGITFGCFFFYAAIWRYSFLMIGISLFFFFFVPGVGDGFFSFLITH